MNIYFYKWLWKSHYIAGMIVVPFVLLLSATGVIYLFKDNYEKELFNNYRTVEFNEKRISLEHQLKIAQTNWHKSPEAIVLPTAQNQSTQFTSGKFSHKSSLFVDPSNGKVLGKINVSETDMHKVRKLHGELLLGSFGTKIVELVASWMFVLIISGVYLFWPRKRGLKGLFTIRLKKSKRIFFRDAHTVLGFWFSILIVVILMGGFPWTDVFGSGYKWVQKNTDSGFPSTWQGQGLTSKETSLKPLSLDEMIQKAQALNLVGEVSLNFPKSLKGVYTVTNQTTRLSEMKSIHLNQYTGNVIQQHSWSDIGIMMKARLWLMAFHQGKFGKWNFILILITAVALTLLSIAAVLSFFKSKSLREIKINPKHNGKTTLFPAVFIIVLAVLLPLFGISLFLVFMFSYVVAYLKKNQSSVLKTS